ncbi:LysR family transcriptional regulator [Cupriavidus sp. AcVe19-1a]|uniref:LysR family transcriptional regulator n=1 Tax=Cupriavidus sp. AcVe19-1a TaxID=2821359 RepID=UPI001AE94850|nr:LysR family transcriptional regulator [Cupriavidus sp. AcVe19-1a]MBP0630266.1 LysR family transcriptional regulator [Cupriavidus sp. AcVe19-1a]
MMVMNEMDNFDMNLLRVFDALWRHGHLGRAAEEIGVSQPAMSHALQRMRDQLGDPLFLKVRTGMQPSPRSVALAPVVQGVLSQVREHLLTAPRFEPAQARRTFTLALSDVGEAAFLPRLLARLMQEAPHVDVRTVSGRHTDIMDQLERGRIDLAIGYYPDLGGSDVFQQRLFRHGFVCLARKDHPIARGRLTAAQFRTLSHAVIQSESRSQELVEAYLRQHDIVRRELLRSPHFLSIPLVIASTDLVVTVPLPVGELFARIADVQVLKPPFPIPAFDLRQHWHRCQHDDPGNRWLRALTQELFGESTGE